MSNNGDNIELIQGSLLSAHPRSASLKLSEQLNFITLNYLHYITLNYLHLNDEKIMHSIHHTSRIRDYSSSCCCINEKSILDSTNKYQKYRSVEKRLFCRKVKNGPKIRYRNHPKMANGC